MAQEPSATAVANEDLWNHFDRQIRFEEAHQNRASVIANLKAEQLRRCPNLTQTS